MAKKDAINIRVKGPIFDADAPQQLIKAANTGLVDLAQFEGANPTGDVLERGHGRDTGTLQRAIWGGASLVSDLVAQYDAGEVKLGANLVYATWIEGISSRNKTTSFKGFHMFRNSRKALEKNIKAQDKYVGKAIAEAFK